MSNHRFSVIIPAHNEEKYIGKCLRAVRSAAKYAAPDEVEMIVVCNRCTDRTADIAKRLGAKVIENSDRCMSSIRNAGVRASTGDIVVTVDADSLMTKYSFIEIREKLASGKFIGGGANPRFDRMSLGIACSAGYVALNLFHVMLKERAFLSGAMFWVYRKDFDAVGGFDESLVSLEDLDFAARLNRLGRTRGQKFGVLKQNYVTTSARKFDEFGDWYLIKNRSLTKRIFTGRDREAADSFYYNVR